MKSLNLANVGNIGAINLLQRNPSCNMCITGVCKYENLDPVFHV